MSTVDTLEEFINPRNVGRIANPDAEAQCGSFVCGAVLRVTLAIDTNQRITHAKFKAAACSFLVSTISMLTAKVNGMTTGEAAALLQAATIDAVPKEREHCQALAYDTLLQAIRSYSDSVRAEWSGDDALICTCFGVSEKTIEREIRGRALQTIEEVTAVCKAGAGCRSCYPLIQDMLDESGLASLDFSL